MLGRPRTSLSQSHHSRLTLRSTARPCTNNESIQLCVERTLFWSRWGTITEPPPKHRAAIAGRPLLFSPFALWRARWSASTELLGLNLIIRSNRSFEFNSTHILQRVPRVAHFKAPSRCAAWCRCAVCRPHMPVALLATVFALAATHTASTGDAADADFWIAEDKGTIYFGGDRQASIGLRENTLAFSAPGGTTVNGEAVVPKSRFDELERALNEAREQLAARTASLELQMQFVLGIVGPIIPSPNTPPTSPPPPEPPAPPPSPPPPSPPPPAPPWALRGTCTDCTTTETDRWVRHVFPSSGSFILSSARMIDYILLVGGGAGCESSHYHAGGGGAGGLVLALGKWLDAGTHTVSVGNGGGGSSNGGGSTWSGPGSGPSGSYSISWSAGGGGKPGRYGGGGCSSGASGGGACAYNCANTGGCGASQSGYDCSNCATEADPLPTVTCATDQVCGYGNRGGSGQFAWASGGGGGAGSAGGYVSRGNGGHGLNLTMYFGSVSARTGSNPGQYRATPQRLAHKPVVRALPRYTGRGRQRMVCRWRRRLHQWLWEWLRWMFWRRRRRIRRPRQPWHGKHWRGVRRERAPSERGGAKRRVGRRHRPLLLRVQPDNVRRRSRLTVWLQN